MKAVLPWLGGVTFVVYGCIGSDPEAADPRSATGDAGGADAADAMPRASKPTITALNHDLADTEGGDAIAIEGLQLAGATAVTVGGTSATITSNSDTSLSFTMPARSAGTYDVRVTTPSGDSNTLPIEAWSPAEMSLTGWWRASYGGLPWTGGILGRNLVTDGDDPSVGPATNGKMAADFSSQNHLKAPLKLADYVGAHPDIRALVFALVKIDAIVTDPGAQLRYLGDTIVGASGGVFGLSVSTGGLHAYALSDLKAYSEATTAVATGSWVLALMKYDGTWLSARVGTGSWTSVTYSTTAIQPETPSREVYVGGIVPGTYEFFDGKVLELGISNVAEDDARVTKLLKYLECRYQLHL